MEKRYANFTVWLFAVIMWIKALVLVIAGLALIFLMPFFVTWVQAENPPEIAEWPPGALEALAGGLGTIGGIILLVLAALFVAVGIGLVKRQNWARYTTIVFSAFDLFSFPVGTILGAYGIYAFGFDEEVKSQYLGGPVKAVPAKRVVPPKKTPAKKKR